MFPEIYSLFHTDVPSSLFLMPGTIIGAFVVDYLGPKWTMITGLLFQAFFGFLMSGLYEQYIRFSFPQSYFLNASTD